MEITDNKLDLINPKKSLTTLALIFLIWPYPVKSKIYTGNPELKILVNKINQLEETVKSCRQEITSLKQYFAFSEKEFYAKKFNGSMDAIFNHLPDIRGHYRLKSVDGNPYYATGKLNLSRDFYALELKLWSNHRVKMIGHHKLKGTASLELFPRYSSEKVKSYTLENVFFENGRDLYYNDRDGKQFHWVLIQKRPLNEKVNFF